MTTLAAPGLLAWCAFSSMQAAAPMKVIVDTDIGDDIDDAFCLALMLNCPELEVLGVTTVHDDTHARARIACQMLYVGGRPDIPVASGGGHSAPNQASWAAGFDLVKPIARPAPLFLVDQINARPGEITLVTIGPLTNVAAALANDPGIAHKVKRIVMMGGAAYVGYNLQPPPCAEWNIRANVPAAQAVFSSGVPITMVGLDVTAMLAFDADKRALLAARGLPLTTALTELYKLWGAETPVLYDPMALATAIDGSLSQTEQRRVVVNGQGITELVEGAPNATVCVKPDVERFFRFYLERVVRPQPPA